MKAKNENGQYTSSAIPKLPLQLKVARLPYNGYSDLYSSASLNGVEFSCQITHHNTVKIVAWFKNAQDNELRYRIQFVQYKADQTHTGYFAFENIEELRQYVEDRLVANLQINQKYKTDNDHYKSTNERITVD